jgi:hypothetical protein
VEDDWPTGPAWLAGMGLATNGFTTLLLSSRNARFRSKKAHGGQFFPGYQIKEGSKLDMIND